MRKIPSLPILALCLSIFVQPGLGGPHERGGQGRGPGQNREFQGIIHKLFAAHERIEREVELTETGYRAKTTSNDPEVARWLRTHVAQMAERLDSGLSVRRWDPAFAEFRDHYEDMVVEIEEIEGGVAVVVSGKTPEAVAVVRNHAAIVSGFVERGPERAHETHPAVVAPKE